MISALAQSPPARVAFPGTQNVALSKIATLLLQGGKVSPVYVGMAGQGTNGGQSFVGTSDHPGYSASGKPMLAMMLGQQTARDAQRGDPVGVMQFLHEYSHAVLGIRDENRANQMAITVLPQLLVKFWHQSPIQARAALAQAISYIKKQQPPLYQLPTDMPAPILP